MIIQRKVTTVLITFLFIANIGAIDAQSVEWLHPFGNSFDDSSANVAIDDDGNNYLVGYFTGTVDFNGNASGGELTAQNTTDIFLLKLSKNGTFIWVKRVDKFFQSPSSTIAITIDKYNEIVLEYFALTEAGYEDVRVKKYAPDGTLLWTRTLGWYGFVGIHQPSRIEEKIMIIDSACDDDFYDEPLSFLNADGSCFKINDLDGDMGSIFWNAYLEHDNQIIMVGELYGTISLNWGGQGITIGEGDSSEDLDWRRSTILAKLSNAGNLESIRVIDYGSNDQESGLINEISPGFMDIDSQGNIYIFSNGYGMVEYGTGDKSIVINHGLNGDGVLLKYTSSGELIWLEQWEAPSNAYITDLKINNQNELILSFAITGTFDVDPKGGEVIYEPSNDGTFNLLLVKLDSDANFIWANDYDVAYGRLELDQDDNLIVNGSYEIDFSLNVNGMNTAVANRGFTDGFIMKIRDENVNSLDKFENNYQVVLSPNPSRGTLRISSKGNLKIDYISVLNQTGNEVFSSQNKNPQIQNFSTVDLQHLVSGFYFVEIYTNKQKITKKLVIVD